MTPPRPGARFGDAGRACRAVALAGLLGGFTVAVRAVIVEWRVGEAEARLAAFPPGDAAPPTPAADRTLPPRAALADALVEAQAAAAGTGADRARRLAAAHALLTRADAGRPRWARVRVVENYLATLEQGARSPAALGAFKASFVGGAFLRDAAPWRIRYGLDQWDRLDPATRAHVVDEAAWFSTLRGGYTGTLAALVGQPAEVPVMRERAMLARLAAAGQPPG